MSEPESWSPCPAGELSQLQETLHQQRAKLRARRRFLIASSSALAATGGMVALTLIPSSPPTPVKLTPVSCREAHDLMTAYLAGTLKSDAKRSSIQAHLDRCPGCKRLYEANA
ncbi:zf-HC2 domain-containing protein [Blastopirellula marina]|uniref:Putative zinc-finger domain-containing protein n=1 Tax=Blastopirellula marina TaxID=124 RepID=A0A2S8GJ37_9BACT|nr:zf-HC2 domain-containing protein [Blastopirellula marina]PQO44459.1 hypothetical protein C5Y93_18790 [Blastopirellula marina]